MPSALPRILVVNVSGIGDFVDSTAALSRLRRARPDARIVLLTSEKVLPLATSCPFIDAAVGLPTARASAMPRLRDAARWLWRIRRILFRCPQAIWLYPVTSRRGAAFVRTLLFLAGARDSAGAVAEGVRSPFARTLPLPGLPVRQAEQFLEVVRFAVPEAAGLPDEPARPDLRLSEAARAAARAFLESGVSPGARAGPLVAVFLGGDRKTRHEDPARAGRWMSELQSSSGVRFVLLGTPGDPGIAPESGVRFLDARGRFDIPGSAALLGLADALVTTHSAPQHIAGALGVPTVVLAGPGNIERFRPALPGEKMRILRQEVPCAPCDHDICPRDPAGFKACLFGIPPADIAAAVRAVLGKMSA